MILKCDTASKYREHLPYKLTVAYWGGSYAYTFNFKDNALTKKNFNNLNLVTFRLLVDRIVET